MTSSSLELRSSHTQPQEFHKHRHMLRCAIPEAQETRATNGGSSGMREVPGSSVVSVVRESAEVRRSITVTLWCQSGEPHWSGAMLRARWSTLEWCRGDSQVVDAEVVLWWHPGDRCCHGAVWQPGAMVMVRWSTLEWHHAWRSILQVYHLTVW